MSKFHVMDGYRFAMRTQIQPEMDSNGHIQRFMPQERHAKAAVKRLSPHGGGTVLPLFGARAPGLPASPRVYGLIPDQVNGTSRTIREHHDIGAV